MTTKEKFENCLEKITSHIRYDFQKILELNQHNPQKFDLTLMEFDGGQTLWVAFRMGSYFSYHYKIEYFHGNYPAPNFMYKYNPTNNKYETGLGVASKFSVNLSQHHSKFVKK